MRQNDNQVEILGYGGSDNSHALAAWASTFYELGLEMPDNINTRVDTIVAHILQHSKRVRSVGQLIAFLGEEGHYSPFRASWFMFGVRNDIASHIQFLTHHVAGNMKNSESARYKVIKEDKIYIPFDWQGTPVREKWAFNLLEASKFNNNLYRECYEELVADGMDKQRAKETARYFKMYSSQMDTIACFNFHGIMQIYEKRRLGTPAQKEIGRIVEDMIVKIKAIPGNPFEHSLKAFGI